MIGAGIAGASAAFELARSASVVLVEMEAQPGHHATGRSAALLNSSVGDPIVCDLATASRPFLESPPEGFCDHPLLSPRGLLWVADADSTAGLDALAVQTAGHTVRLDAAGARALVPSVSDAAVAAGALHEPAAMTIDVASLLAGYLRGVRAAGAVVRTSEKAKIAAVAEFLSSNPRTAIEVEGHCDERGTIEYNLALGERRANAAKRYIVRLGVDAGRLSTISYGEERPANSGSNEAAWSENRRAEFVILSQ